MLGQEEVARLLEAAPGLKFKAALSMAYGAGLRMSEIVKLKVSDIDSERMTLRVEQGGTAGSPVLLSPRLLNSCANGGGRPAAGLAVPGQDPINPVTSRQLDRAVSAAHDGPGSPSAYRRTRCATASRPTCSNRASTGVIQVLLGHAKLETTALYTRVAVSTIRDVRARWTGSASP